MDRQNPLTGRRQPNEPALTEDEQHLRLILDSVGEGLFCVDRAGQITFVNPAAARMIGRPVGDLIGRSAHDTFHHRHPDGSPYPIEDCPVCTAYTDGEIREVRDETFWLPDRTSFPVEYLAAPIRDGGDVLGAVVTFRDISDRKAEEIARRERDFTRTVINGLPAILYVLSSNGRFELWNGNLEAVSGYSADEIGRMSPTDIFENEDTTLAAGGVMSALADGSGSIEASLITKTGQRIPYFITRRRLSTDTTAKRVGMGIDISSRRRLEEALRRSNQELARFADISAHHLMEPSRRLISFSQRLRTSLAGRIDDPDAQESLNFIEDEAKRLRVLLRDIQLYLVADQPLGEAAVDTEQIVHATIKRLADPILDAGATVTVGALPSAPIDAARLSNLFDILLMNALQYRRPGIPPEIRIDGQKIDDALQYRIADNGCGIPAEYRERVFQVFERLQPRSAPDNDGSGIGLSIVRRIVVSCGGRTWIEETPGGGTTVIVELPVGAKS